MTAGMVGVASSRGHSVTIDVVVCATTTNTAVIGGYMITV